MKVACDLGQPAVVGIEEELLIVLGKDILIDRVKQMVGHMVRQVMEKEGFVIDQGDVKIHSVPFSKGTRYKRPDWHPVHVFRNSGDPRDLCFTDTRTGDKLPALAGKSTWRYWTSFSTALRGSIAFGVKPSELRQEIMKRGYVRQLAKRMLRAG